MTPLSSELGVNHKELFPITSSWRRIIPILLILIRPSNFGSFKRALCDWIFIVLWDIDFEPCWMSIKLRVPIPFPGTGETILVTDRDRVVAELGPPQEGRAARLSDAQLAEAVRQGWLTPPLMVREDPPPFAPVAPLREILAELDEDREDR